MSVQSQKLLFVLYLTFNYISVEVMSFSCCTVTIPLVRNVLFFSSNFQFPLVSCNLYATCHVDGGQFSEGHPNLVCVSL